MKRVFLLFFVMMCFAEVHAVGSMKKRRHIYVRRELATPAQAQPPAETHNPARNYHALRCKGTGWKRCDWRRRPKLQTAGYSLDALDELVATVLRNQTISQGTWQLGNLGIYYRRLPTG